MYEKIIIFKTNLVVFEKYTIERVGKKYGTTLRGELVGELSETVVVLIRNDLLAHLPTQFSGISSCEIPFATMSIFHKNHVMHSHLTSKLPSAYEKALCHFSKPFIQYVNMHIFSQLPLHTCNSTHQPSPNLAHLSNIQYHLQWLTNTILFHIIVSLC